MDLRTKASISPISNQGVSVYIVEDYKYLGTHINNKLDCMKNTNALYNRGVNNTPTPPNPKNSQTITIEANEEWN